MKPVTVTINGEKFDAVLTAEYPHTNGDDTIEYQIELRFKVGDQERLQRALKSNGGDEDAKSRSPANTA